MRFLIIVAAFCFTAVAASAQYNEPWRPQFHFSPPAKWMNDPNGMFYFDGEYHLFYQYYPDGNTWGPMHWGHVVSRNMVEWQQLPIALYPDSLGYIFSGSAVVDHHNTSGLSKNNQPPVIAIYTYHNMPGEKAGRNDFQYQGLAYSHDKGRTWVKYEKNPVLPNTTGIKDFRDPKVMWHEKTKRWIMTLAVKDHVEFWTSPNLLQWNYSSSFGKELGAHGGVWECPDLFPLKDPATNEEKYVLMVSINPGGPNGGSATQYFVGDFNGKEFIPHTSHQNKKPVWLDYGRDNYAGVTWSNIPDTDGRRLFIGWMSNWDYAQVVPTTVWRSAMTLPRSLNLHKENNGYRLQASPVEELKLLRERFETTDLIGELTGRYNLTSAAIPPQQSEWVIEAEVTDPKTEKFYLQFSNSQNEIYRVGYDMKKKQYFSDRTAAGNYSFSEKFAAAVHIAAYEKKKRVRLHLFMDASSAELFADNGFVCLTDLVFPSKPFDKAELIAEGGSVRIVAVTSYALKKIW